MKTGNRDSRKTIYLVMTVFLTGIAVCTYAQSPTDTLPKDPGKMSVYTVQNLNFGAIYQGSLGGTVVVSANGSRSVTGDVVAINQGFAVFPSIFEVVAPAGTLLTIQNGPDVTLSGSNGGSMTLRLGTSSPASPYITTIPPPGRTQISIGGTLTVGNTTTSKAGSYSGTFSVIFYQQ